MLSTIVSILIFTVPIAVFLAVQFFNQANRNKGHWPQPRRPEEPASAQGPEQPREPQPRRRKTKVRAPQGPSCGREITHALLTVVGARDSCRHCAALQRNSSKDPIDLLAEAERIANEAQD